MKVQNKKVRDLVHELQDMGWVLDRQGKHIKMVHPKTQTPIFLSITPSDHRGIANIRSLAKRLISE